MAVYYGNNFQQSSRRALLLLVDGKVCTIKQNLHIILQDINFDWRRLDDCLAWFLLEDALAAE
jgi:hypothetical protein